VAGLYILVAQRDVSLYIHISLHTSPRHISKFSSVELITTTFNPHCYELEELPQLMESASYEHAPLSTAGNGSCPKVGYGECYYLLSSHLPMNRAPCVNIHTEHSLPQISKGIPCKASQGERGSGDSGREQRKGWPLQEGPRILE
jgi:hypothetical protein